MEWRFDSMFISISSCDAILGVNTFEGVSWAKVWTLVDDVIFLELTTKLKHSTWAAAFVRWSTLNSGVMRSVNEELKQIIGRF